MKSAPRLPQIGIVAIGRNESLRLKACLRSIVALGNPAVYVDSGSTDGSVELARAQGMDVLELDKSIPFTAARARNEGFQFLTSSFPALDFIQFIDGDCTLAAGWFEHALAVMISDPETGAISGRRREKSANENWLLRLMDIEWKLLNENGWHFGGDVMLRRSAFEDTGGYNEGLIAGEDPEFSHRLHVRGWEIRSVNHAMTTHDAGDLDIRDWFARQIRSGHAYAQVADISGRDGTPMWSRQVWSNLVWGGGLPIGVGLVEVLTSMPAVWLFLLYPMIVTRIYFAHQRRLGNKNALLYASACLMSKFPSCVGQIRYYLTKLLRKNSALIEYK